MTYVLLDGYKPPLCRYCGKAIRKYTRQFWPHREPDPVPKWQLEVISRRHSKSGAVKYYVLWDGRTYVDEFFCTNRCAISFGRLAASGAYVTSVAYSDALKRQRGEKVK